MSSSTSTGSESSSGAKTPIGAIVGGVVGGVALILAFVLFWRLGQRQMARSEKSFDVSHQNKASPGQAIHPFVVPVSPLRLILPQSQLKSELASVTKSSASTGPTMQTSGSSSVPPHRRLDLGSLSAAGSLSLPASGSPGIGVGGTEGSEVGGPPPPAYHDIV